MDQKPVSNEAFLRQILRDYKAKSGGKEPTVEQFADYCNRFATRYAPDFQADFSSAEWKQLIRSVLEEDIE